MSNDIPLRGGGGGNFILPLMRDRLLKSHLLSDLLPPFFSQGSFKIIIKIKLKKTMATTIEQGERKVDQVSQRTN
jgi:hypothetical protein